MEQDNSKNIITLEGNQTLSDLGFLGSFVIATVFALPLLFLLAIKVQDTFHRTVSDGSFSTGQEVLHLLIPIILFLYGILLLLFRRRIKIDFYEDKICISEQKKGIETFSYSDFSSIRVIQSDLLLITNNGVEYKLRKNFTIVQLNKILDRFFKANGVRSINNNYNIRYSLDTDIASLRNEL